VLVFAAFDDLALRKLGESELTRRLAPYGVVGLPAHQVLFPARSYNSEELQTELAERHIGAVLVVSVTDAGTSESYVPPTFHTRMTGSQTATTTQTGGYTYNKPWAAFRGELFDISSERAVWFATANSGGNAFSSRHTLVRSLCGRIATQLYADGVVSRETP
jgi:hypothetical protein